MKLAFSLAIVSCLVPATGYSNSIDGSWSITGFSGEAWFVKPNNLIGKTQEFSGGSSSGPLYSCDFAGQSMTYTTYENDDLFANAEFTQFGPLREEMTLSSKKLFVHRITCDGNGDPSQRRVLYPIVTNEARASAWYLYEGGVFSLFRPK
jgi:hypothetical protein